MEKFDELDHISAELDAQLDAAADKVMAIVDRKKRTGRQRPDDWDSLMKIFEEFQRDRVDRKFTC